MAELYKLTDFDRQIFALSESDPNIFTDWYMRGPNTGTWYAPDDADPRKSKRYAELFSIWNDLGKPKGEFKLDGQLSSGKTTKDTYRIIFKLLKPQPFFHWWHGFRFDPWQLDLYLARQNDRFIAGGFGGGKTIGVGVGLLVRAAILPGYRAFGLAPYSNQAKEIYKKLMLFLTGTAYEEKFLRGKHVKPYPELTIGNEYVGENTIEFYSIMEDSEKILNLEGDEAMVDQAEELNHIDDHRRAISSRLRGYHQGREKLALTTWIGNPYDNPEFWDMYDLGIDEPQHYYCYTVSTYENYERGHISKSQMDNFERVVGGDEQNKNVYLKGQRPVGSGKQFVKESIEKCRSQWLDDLMADALEHGFQDYVKLEAPKIGVHKWELPPKEDGTYVVIADAGTKDPPYRDSAVVGVWDITDFPNTPARLAAFTWVFGKGSPEPWMQQFFDYVQTYHAVTRCAFDATNLGAGYDRWLSIFYEKLMAEPLRLGGTNKFMYINATKVLMAAGMIEYPSIPVVISQLAKYDLPDENLRQDVAMMVIMTCGWLERAFYLKREDMDKHRNSGKRVEGRYDYHDSRYADHIR